jgi:hypothetical protein
MVEKGVPLHLEVEYNCTLTSPDLVDERNTARPS